MKQKTNARDPPSTNTQMCLRLRRTPMRATILRRRRTLKSRSTIFPIINIANIEYAMLQREQHYKQKRWKTLIQTIQNQSDRICHGKIHTSFLRETFMKSQTVFLAYIHKPYQRNQRYFLGFVTVQQPQQPSTLLYLDLLGADRSTPGLGVQLVHRVEEYARQHNFTRLQLSSVASVMNYWRKLGFRYGNDGNESDAIQLAVSSCSDIVFQCDADAEQHPEFRKLLQLLIDSNLCHKKLCTSIDTSDEGYIMTKCIR